MIQKLDLPVNEIGTWEYPLISRKLFTNYPVWSQRRKTRQLKKLHRFYGAKDNCTARVEIKLNSFIRNRAILIPLDSSTTGPDLKICPSSYPKRQLAA